MTAVQNAGKLLVLWASFCSARDKSIHWSRACWWSHTINYLLLTGFICLYLKIQCHHFYPWLFQPWFSHTEGSGFIVPYYVLSNLVSTSNHNIPVLFLVWCSNFTDIKIQTSRRLQNGKKSKIWKLKNHFFSDWKAITSLRRDLFQQRKVC